MSSYLLPAISIWILQPDQRLRLPPRWSGQSWFSRDCRQYLRLRLLYVQSDLEVDGNVYLGTSTANSLSVSGYVTSNLIPNRDPNYDLGSNTRKWLTSHYADTSHRQ